MGYADPRARFFEAAQDILATEGYGGLKLAVVCQRLGVTTGAFYHAFESWNEFTSALLETWRRERTTLIADIAKSTGEPVAQLESLLQATLELRHKSERAIRVWAAVDAEVARVQAQVDEDRYAVVYDAMEQIVGDEDADRFTNWGLNQLLGFEASPTQNDPAELEWQLRQVLNAAVAHRQQSLG